MKTGRPGLIFPLVKLVWKKIRQKASKQRAITGSVFTSSTDVSANRLSDSTIKNLKNFRSEPRSTE